MLLPAYARGKYAALSKFALLTPQEEQAFGYGNAAQRAGQVHGVAEQHAAGRSGNHAAFQQADDAQLMAAAQAQPQPQGGTVNQRAPLPSSSGATRTQAGGADARATAARAPGALPQANMGVNGTHFTPDNTHVRPATQVGPAPARPQIPMRMPAKPLNAVGNVARPPTSFGPRR